MEACAMTDDRTLIINAAERVMGWTVVPFEWEDRREEVFPRLIENINLDWVLCLTERGEWNEWNPLESITDAWMLVEELAKRHTLISVKNLFDGDSVNWWVCTATGYTQPHGYINGQWQEDADSAPRAIVLAALQACGVANA
jgi:hypothetical protein